MWGSRLHTAVSGSGFNRVVVHVRAKIGRAPFKSAASRTAPRLSDPLYLDQPAGRLAADASLPLALARKRVMALAVSARPRVLGDGFRNRGR